MQRRIPGLIAAVLLVVALGLGILPRIVYGASSATKSLDISLASVALPGLESSDAPSIEDFKDRLFIAVTGTGEDSNNLLDPILINTIDQDGQNLGSWTAIPGLTSASGPAIKVFKKKLYIAARGPDDRVYLAASKNGTTWSAWSAVPGSIATEAPALKVFKDRLYLAARGADGSIAINYTKNGTSWDTWRMIPNSVTPYAPALTQFKGKLLLGFTVATANNGENGYIYLTSSSNGKDWSARTQVPAFGLGGENGDVPLTTDVGPGLTVLDGDLYVSARVGDFDTEDGLYLITNDGTRWSTWLNSGRAIEGSATLTTFDDTLYIGTRFWDSATLELLYEE